MSGDLYRDESMESVSRLAPVKTPEASAFDGFIKGSAMYAMRGFAQTARAVDMAGAAIPVAYDKLVGGTEASDKYFQEHEGAFDSAIDYWTPKAGEVGTAGEVVGGLISTLPTVMLSPALAIAGTELGTAEDLSKRGVSAEKAIGAGVLEGATLATGIWMPILGRNLWQRAILGGVGFNTAQGVVSRAGQSLILEGTPAADDFKAFDPKSMTLDALMGAAFGTLAHVNPEARAQSAKAWERISAWAEKLNPSDVDALLVLRQAQHLNDDSTPGKPLSTKDVDAHVERLKSAINDLAEGRDVRVDDMPAGDFEADDSRWIEGSGLAKELVQSAEQYRQELGIPKPPETEKAVVALRIGNEIFEARPGEMTHGQILNRLVKESPEIIAPPNEATREIESGWAKGKRFLTREQALAELGYDDTQSPAGIRAAQTEGPQATRSGPPPGEGKPVGPEADPLAAAADSFAESNKDLKLRVGTDADGKPIVRTAREFLDGVKADVQKARDDTKLFAAAAECMLGAV